MYKRNNATRQRLLILINTELKENLLNENVFKKDQTVMQEPQYIQFNESYVGIQSNQCNKTIEEISKSDLYSSESNTSTCSSISYDTMFTTVKHKRKESMKLLKFLSNKKPTKSYKNRNSVHILSNGIDALDQSINIKRKNSNRST